MNDMRNTCSNRKGSKPAFLWKMAAALMIVLVMFFSACRGAEPENSIGSEVVSEKETDTKPDSSSAVTDEPESRPETIVRDTDEETDMEEEQMTGGIFTLKMKIGETPVAAAWEDNETTEALKTFAAEGPVSIRMSMYGGFEQVGPIGRNLPSKDVRVSTEPGDLVLYQSSQLVVFYGTNTWEYTRLGKITDKTPEQLEELLGKGDVVITLYME